MSGRWLEERGFSIGETVYVEAEEGRLILTNDTARSADLMESRGSNPRPPACRPEG